LGGGGRRAGSCGSNPAVVQDKPIPTVGGGGAPAGCQSVGAAGGSGIGHN